MNWKTIDNPLFVFESNDEFAKFHFNYASKAPPAELFHYTQGESFLAIASSQCMFATERSFLNDPQEFRWGLQLFEHLLDTHYSNQYPHDFVEKVREGLTAEDYSRLFVISLSANPDLLSQWRAYAGNGQGFAIGLDGQVLRDRAGFGEIVLQDIDLDIMPQDFVFCYHLLPVLYDKPQQENAISGFLDAAYSHWTKLETTRGKAALQSFDFIIQHRVKELLISFKNPGYREEDEWRIIATLHKRSEKILYRYGRFGITPYVKLNLSPRVSLPTLNLPLTSIWIGPDSPAKQNTRGLEMFCENRNFKVPLKTSQIEYRA